MAQDGEDDLSGTDDLRGALNAALLEHSDAPPAPEPPKSAPSAAPDADKAQSDRARDETGKFTTKPVEQQAPASAASKSATPQAQTETAAPAPAVPRVPQSWAKEQHAGFAQLPPATQDYILKREDEMHRALSQRDERINLADRISRAIQPHSAMIEKLGIRDPAEHFGMMMNVQAMFAKNPVGALQHLAAQSGYQIQLSPIHQSQQPGAPAVSQSGQQPLPAQQPAQLPPQLMQTIQMLEQQAVRSEEQKYIDGGHPHYYAVRDRMDSLLTSGQAKTLDDAYDAAVWLDPNLREQMITGRMQSAAPPVAAAPDQEAVRRAKAAGNAGVRGAPSGTTGSAPKASLRDELRAAAGLQ